MKRKLIIAIGAMVLVNVWPVAAGTLTVTGNAVADSGLYDYSYQFGVLGSGLNVDNIYLGSDDLSPLNVMFAFDGVATTDWSWLGNDTPMNYLQFFNTAGAISANDVLSVTFTSVLAPGSTFAVGFDSSTSTSTNRVVGILAPTATTATPEPASVWMLFFGILVLVAASVRRGSWANKLSRIN